MRLGLERGALLVSRENPQDSYFTQNPYPHSPESWSLRESAQGQMLFSTGPHPTPAFQGVSGGSLVPLDAEDSLLLPSSHVAAWAHRCLWLAPTHLGFGVLEIHCYLDNNL